MEFQVERVHAAVRVRKAHSYEGSDENNDPSTDVVTVTSGCADGDTIAIRSRSGKGMVEFSLDAAFGESCSQDDVYEYVSPMVNGVSQGINTTVFAYGQTGTGKTFTMLGEGLEEQLLRSGSLQTHHESASLTKFNSGWGVIPRAVASLFDSLSAAAGSTAGQRHVEVVCSYMQIYQDRLYDLLTDGKMQHPLQVREAPGPEGASDERSAARGKRPVDSGVYVQGLSQFRVASLGDVLALLHRGASNRAVRATEYNLHSSRSHAILQLGVEVEVLAADSQAPTPRPNSRDLSRNSNASVMSASGSRRSSSSSSSSNISSDSSTPNMGNSSRQNSSQSRHRPSTGTRAAGAGSSDFLNSTKQSSRQGTPHINKSRPVSVSASNTGSSGAGGGVVELRRAKLSLIDLAGSEKWGEGAYASDKGGHAMSRELTAINSSLSALGNCIAALADRRRKHVPFRDSALTRLLQDSLGGNCRTLVLATVSPHLTNLEETASTLAFATRATAVTARLRPNQMMSDTLLLAKAQREISALKKSLILSKSAEAAAVANGTKQLSPLAQGSSVSPTTGASEFAVQQRAALASRERLEAEVASLRGHVEYLEAELRRKADALERGAEAEGEPSTDEALNTEQHDAAVKVQSLQRRRDASNEVRRRRKNRAEHTEQQHEAAGKLQNLHRRRKASEELRNKKAANSSSLASESIIATSSEIISPHDIETSPLQSAYGSQSSRPSTVSRLDFSRVSTAQGPAYNLQHDSKNDNQDIAASGTYSATEVLDSACDGAVSKSAQSLAPQTDVKDKTDAIKASPSNCYARALYEWRGEESGDLSLNAGQLVRVHDRNASGWWGGTIVPYVAPPKVPTPRGRKRPLPNAPGAAMHNQPASSPMMMSPTSSIDSASSYDSSLGLRGDMTTSSSGLFPCHYVEVLDARGLAMHFPGFDEDSLNGSRKSRQGSALASAQPSAPMMSSPPPVPLVAPSLISRESASRDRANASIHSSSNSANAEVSSSSMTKARSQGSMNKSATSAEIDAAADAGRRAAARDNATSRSNANEAPAAEVEATMLKHVRHPEEDLGDDSSVRAVAHARSGSRSARRKHRVGAADRAVRSSASSVASDGSGQERGARSPKLRLRRRIVGVSDESVSSNPDNYDAVKGGKGIAAKQQSPRDRFSRTSSTDLVEQKRDCPKENGSHMDASSSSSALAATAPMAHVPDISPIRSPRKTVAESTEPTKSAISPPAAAHMPTQNVNSAAVTSTAATHASADASPSPKKSPPVQASTPTLSPEDIVRRSEARRARGDGIRARGAALVDPSTANAATGVEEVGRRSNSNKNRNGQVIGKTSSEHDGQRGAEMSRDETRREAVRRVEVEAAARREDIARAKAELHTNRQYEAKLKSSPGGNGAPSSYPSDYSNSNHGQVSPDGDTSGGASTSRHISPQRALAVEATVSSTLRALRAGAEAIALQVARNPVTSSSPSSPGYHTSSSSSSGGPPSKSTGSAAATGGSSWHAAVWRGDVEGTGTLTSHFALERLARKVLAVRPDAVSPQALRALFDHLTSGQPPSSSGGRELPLAALVRAMVRAGPSPSPDIKTTPPKASPGDVVHAAPQEKITSKSNGKSRKVLGSDGKGENERSAEGERSIKDRQQKAPSRESLQKLSAAVDAYSGSKHRTSSLAAESTKKKSEDAPVRDQRTHLGQSRRHTNANENMFPPVPAAASKAAKAALTSTHGAAKGLEGAALRLRQQGKSGAGGGKDKGGNKNNKSSRTSKSSDEARDILLPDVKPSSNKVKAKALPVVMGAQNTAVASNSPKKAIDKEGGASAAKSHSSSVGRSSRESPFKSKKNTPQQKQAGSSSKKKKEQQPSTVDQSSGNITWLDDDIGKAADDNDARSQLQRKLVHALAEAESEPYEGKLHSPVAASMSSSSANMPSPFTKSSPGKQQEASRDPLLQAVGGYNNGHGSSSFSRSGNIEETERNSTRVSPPRPEPKRQDPSPSQPLQEQPQQQLQALPPVVGGESRCTRHGIASCVLCSLSYAQSHQPQATARPSFGSVSTNTTTVVLPPARGTVAAPTAASSSTGLPTSSFSSSNPMASKCDRHGLARCVLCSGFMNQQAEPTPQPPLTQGYSSASNSYSSFTGDKFSISSSNYYSATKLATPQVYQGGSSSVPSSLGIRAPVPYSSYGAYSSGPNSNGSGFGAGNKHVSGVVGQSAVGMLGYRDGVPATASALKSVSSSSSSCERHGLANCFLCTLNAPKSTQPTSSSHGFTASKDLGSSGGVSSNLARSNLDHHGQLTADTNSSEQTTLYPTPSAPLSSPFRSSGVAVERSSHGHDSSDVNDSNNSGDESSEANEEEYLKVSIAARQRERDAKNAQLQPQPAAATPSPYNTVAPAVAAGSGGRRQRKQQQQQQHKKPKASGGKVSANQHRSPSAERRTNAENSNSRSSPAGESGVASEALRAARSVLTTSEFPA